MIYKKGQKGFSSIILTAILAVVIIASGVGYLIAKKPAPLVVQPTPIWSATPTITPSPTPDETAGWKTYRNDKYGFEFKYPSGIIKNEGKPASAPYLIVSTPFFWILNYSANGLSLEEWLEARKITYYQKEYVKLGDLNFLKIFEPGVGEGDYIFYIKNSNDIFAITTVPDKVNSTFYQILSTLKFIEKDGTADWKTYFSPVMRFSIDYPSDWSAGKEEVLSTGTEIEFTKNQDARINIRSGVRYNQNLGRNYTLKEWISGYRDSLIRYNPDFTEKKIIFMGKEATGFDYKITINNPPTTFREIYLENNASIYEIAANFSSDKESIYKPIIDQMLYTFKFTK